MARTGKRPLPAGELAPNAVLGYGIVVCVSGVVVLALLANQLAAAIAAFSALFYVLVYTMWLKRRTAAALGMLYRPSVEAMFRMLPPAGINGRSV